jgi:AcrR family transcriptional regulator
MRSSAVMNGKISPNQAEKRQQIIEAAKGVLAREGLAKCTTRAIADASPLTKSAIHYYFTDLDDIIDQAMESHITAFTERINTAAAREAEPFERLWAAASEYLTIFSELPSALALWYEYWVDAVRRGRLAPAEGMFVTITGIFTGLLTELGVSQPELRGPALTSFLVGAVTQQAVSPRPIADIKAQVTILCRSESAIGA